VDTKVLKGMDFSVAGIVRTENSDYVVMVDESTSFYFPISSGSVNTNLIEMIFSGDFDFELENYGIYFSFLSMFKAHDMCPTQVSFIIKKDGGTTCSMDVSEENELGVKVSRIPLLLSDAVVLCSLGRIPIVIYGCAGTDFVFKIDKNVPKQNIFSFIGEEISQSERMAAIDSENNQK